MLVSRLQPHISAPTVPRNPHRRIFLERERFTAVIRYLSQTYGCITRVDNGFYDGGGRLCALLLDGETIALYDDGGSLFNRRLVKIQDIASQQQPIRVEKTLYMRLLRYLSAYYGSATRSLNTFTDTRGRTVARLKDALTVEALNGDSFEEKKIAELWVRTCHLYHCPNCLALGVAAKRIDTHMANGEVHRLTYLETAYMRPFKRPRNREEPTPLDEEVENAFDVSHRTVHHPRKPKHHIPSAKPVQQESTPLYIPESLCAVLMRVMRKKYGRLIKRRGGMFYDATGSIVAALKDRDTVTFFDENSEDDISLTQLAKRELPPMLWAAKITIGGREVTDEEKQALLPQLDAE